MQNKSELSAQSTRDLDAAELKLPLWKANFWYFILWLMMLIDVMDRQAVNAVLPLLKKSFQLTDTQAGLVSSVLGLSIALFAVPVAMLADKWSRRKMVSIMIAFWSVATYGTGLAKGFGSLVVARLCVGTGEAGYGGVAYSLISAWYSKKIRGTMIGLFHAAAPVGNAVGVMVAGYLAYKYGWRTCFGILAVPGLILAVLAWFMPDFKIKKIECEKTDTNDDSNKVAGEKTQEIKITDALLYIFKSPTVIATFLIFGSAFIATNSIGTWGPTFFARTFDMNVKDAAKAMGIASLLAIGGAPLMGFLGDRLLKYTEKGRLIAAATSALLFFVCITLSLQNAMNIKDYNTVFIFWTLSFFFLFGIPACVGAVTQDLVPPHFRTITASFLPLSNHLIGGVWGPIIAGAISDRHGLAYALQAVSVIAIILVIAFILFGAIFYNRDLNRIRKMGTFKLDKD